LFYGPPLAATSRLPFGPQQEAAEVESKVVLIVDDSEDNRFLYQTILTYAGYTVLEARQGVEGVELAREYHPNLVLMDIHMPVLDGWGA
jgi:CheY-like chemotaxis protein